MTVTTRGPLFDGRATHALDDGTKDIERTIAVLGASIIRTELSKVLRIETPIYRFKVEAKPEPPGWKIWDQRMIYGPWLEGTGSRNRTTRFKGYATFRRKVIEINARAKAIGSGVMAKYMGRMQ